jgi:hypothetical protein
VPRKSPAMAGRPPLSDITRREANEANKQPDEERCNWCGTMKPRGQQCACLTRMTRCGSCNVMVRLEQTAPCPI